jgi:hypothetical protein
MPLVFDHLRLDLRKFPHLMTQRCGVFPLIIVVCVTAITTLGSNANNSFSYVGTKIGGSGS